jgi:uncharacterized protein YdhG (YjbR/CyaY superfamily)
MTEVKAKNIEEYITSCAPEIQPRLRELRQLIRDVEPSLKEKISWQMPTFYAKHNVIHFAAHKNHIGIYPGPDAIERFSDRLKGYKVSKGAFQIPYDKPFDRSLIADMIRFNLGKDTSFSG